MSHLFTFEGKTFSPDGKVNVTAEEAAQINADTNAKELAHWATKPESFAPAYYYFPAEKGGGLYRPHFRPFLHDNATGTNANVTTWRGSRIGIITSARVYRHNFGGRMVSITVRGTNGADYYGRASWDNGNVIRLRKVKG